MEAATAMEATATVAMAVAMAATLLTEAMATVAMAMEAATATEAMATVATAMVVTVVTAFTSPQATTKHLTEHLLVVVTLWVMATTIKFGVVLLLNFPLSNLRKTRCFCFSLQTRFSSFLNSTSNFKLEKIKFLML